MRDLKLKTRDAAPPPQSTWGTGAPAAAAPAPSGPIVVGPSKVVPAPPPLIGVPEDAPAAPAPRTWGIDPAPAPS